MTKQERAIKAAVIALGMCYNQLEEITDVIYDSEDLAGYRKAADYISETILEAKEGLETL